MKTIKFIEAHAVGNGVYSAGEIDDFEDELAERLVAKGMGIDCTIPKPEVSSKKKWTKGKKKRESTQPESTEEAESLTIEEPAGD